MKEFQLNIIRFIQQAMTPILDRVAEGITMLGEEEFLIVAIAFIYLVLNKKFGQKIVYIMLASMTLNTVIKNLVQAPRPIGEPGIITIRAETAGGYSFPSGHTQNISTFLGGVMNKIKKSWFTVLSIVLIILVAVSRLYLGVHYPIDVIIGAGLGVAVALIGSYIFDSYSKHQMLILMTVAIFLPFAIYFGIRGDVLSGDFFRSYGLFLGFLAAIVFEEKYVNFTMQIPLWKKAVRLVFGVSLLLGLQLGLKAIFPDNSLFHLLRYFLIAFIGLGIYPYLFHRFHF